MGRPSTSQRSRARNRQKSLDFVNYGTATGLLRAQAPESPRSIAQTYTPSIPDEPYQVPVDAPTPIWGVVAQEIAAMYPGPGMGGPSDTTCTYQNVNDWPIDPALTLEMDMEWTGAGTTLDASFGIPALEATSFDISAIPSPPPGWPDADKLRHDPSVSSFNKGPDVADGITAAMPASPSRSVNNSSSKAEQSTSSRVSKSSPKKNSKKASPPKNKHARGPTKQMDEVNATKLPQLPQPRRIIDPLATPEPDDPPAPSCPDVSPGSCPPGALPTAHLPPTQFSYPHPLLPTEDATLVTLRQAGWRYSDIIDRFKDHFGPRITENALVKRSQKLHSLYGVALTAAINRALPTAFNIAEQEMAKMGLTGPSIFERRSIEQGIAWAISGRMHLQRYESPERAAQSNARRDQQARMGDTFESWMTKNPQGAAGYIAKVKHYD